MVPQDPTESTHPALTIDPDPPSHQDPLQRDIEACTEHEEALSRLLEHAFALHQAAKEHTPRNPGRAGLLERHGYFEGIAHVLQPLQGLVKGHGSHALGDLASGGVGRSGRLDDMVDTLRPYL